MSHKLNLDICTYEGTVEQEMNVALINCDCTATLVTEHGPGGGNPNWDIFGTKDNLSKFLTTWYLKEDPEDVEYFLSTAVEV